ncbi:MAG: hypothetical protein F9K32_15215 [Desulfobulbaceae bacterium]|nr:MAG: hypothetical protein F9K32_15215 [Desulfobulbaceae bacterium]
METGKPAVTIKFYDDGTFQVFNEVKKNGRLQQILVDETLPEELGPTFKDRTIHNAQGFSVVYLRSNPRWVCINGKWYYIP